MTYSITGASGVTYTPAGGSDQNLAGYGSWIQVSGSDLRITPQAEMKAGKYTVTITGTSSGGTHTRTLDFTVNDAPLTKSDPAGPVALAAGASLGTINYGDYFSDPNGKDQFTITGLLAGPGGVPPRVLTATDFNADGTIKGNLPDVAGAYTLNLVATPVFGAAGQAQTVIITINAASTVPTFIGSPPTSLTVDETIAADTAITGGDFNARAAGRSSGEDARGGVTYSLKGGTGPDFMSDDEVGRYLEIDANGQVKVKAPLPNQDDGAVRVALRAPVKFIVVATDSADRTKTTEHTVTLTIRNVLDETPTFTLPTGLTSTAGQTIFKDNAAKSLSAVTTETGGDSPAHRVVEFFESPTERHDNVRIATDGAITLTGSPAAGTISFKWYWKYAGESSVSASEIAARTTITVEYHRRARRSDLPQ